MSASTFSSPQAAGVEAPLFVKRLTAIVVLMSLAALSGAATYRFGVGALAIPVGLGAVALVALVPERFAFLLLLVGIILEPNSVDWTGPIAEFLWRLPDGVTLPITVSPVEILMVVSAGALIIRRAPGWRPALPRIVWFVPVVMLLGLAYGLRSGGPYNLAYHEMRGLIFGIVAFIIAWRMPSQNQDSVLRWLVAASTGLGLVLLGRYLFYVRTDNLDVPLEFAFAHEDAVYLAFGFVLGIGMLIRAEHWPARLFFVAHNLIVISALVGTSRRAATLALVVGLLTFAWMMLPRRPVVVIAVSVPCLLVATAYLGAFWNKEYGAMAQPARAIRSQISPSARDHSSDLYRDIEVFNVEQTIRLNRPFGIGFGRPYAQFWPLPDLSSNWELQTYTPHQNIMWLWLKMGVLGITVMLAAWVLAFRRAVAACRSAPTGVFPVAATLVGAGLMMYLAYAKVDLAFIGTRSTAGLGILMAMAFRLRVQPEEARPGEQE